MARTPQNASQTVANRHRSGSPQDRSMVVAEKYKMQTTEQEDGLRAMLRDQYRAIDAIIPEHLTVDSVCITAIQAVVRNPRLMETMQKAPETVVLSIVEAATMGLMLTGPLGHAYLVPRWNNNNRRLECTMLVGYRGYIELACNSGDIVPDKFRAEPIYDCDKYRIIKGTTEILEHEPELLRDENAKLIGAYAVVDLVHGGHQFRVMPAVDIYKVRECSESYKAYKDGKLKSCPWLEWPGEFFRKTAIRNLAKTLRLSPEIQRIALRDELRDQGLLHLPEAAPQLPKPTQQHQISQNATQAPQETPQVVDATAETVQEDKSSDEPTSATAEDLGVTDEDRKKRLDFWARHKIELKDLERKVQRGYDEWDADDLTDLDEAASKMPDGDNKNSYLIGVFSLEPGSLG